MTRRPAAGGGESVEPVAERVERAAACADETMADEASNVTDTDDRWMTATTRAKRPRSDVEPVADDDIDGGGREARTRCQVATGWRP